jgi:hypothetical protein
MCWLTQAALPLASDHVHRPRTSLSRVEAALHYEQLLRAHFSLSAGELPVFDVVVLDGFGAAGEDAVQLGRLVLPSGSGRALVLSAAVVRAAAQVLTVRPSEAFVPAREAG